MDLTRATWRKSTRSNANGACVEVAQVADLVAVRDSKDADGGVLVFSPTPWAAFVAAARDGSLTA